jgi:hypothetical protein
MSAFPQKRTSLTAAGMSALRHKQTSVGQVAARSCNESSGFIGKLRDPAASLFRHIRITALVFDIQFRSSSIAKGESIVGIKSDCLVVISEGMVVVAFVRKSITPIPKGEGALRIEPDRLVKISNGSIIVASVRIEDASVPKGVSTLGIDSDRFVKIGEGSVVVAFVRISDAPVTEGESAFGIKSDCLVVISEGTVVVAFVRISVASTNERGCFWNRAESPRCNRRWPCRSGRPWHLYCLG